MAELKPVEPQPNGGPPPAAIIPDTLATAAPVNAAPVDAVAVTAVGSKRQRRPSVRLGEIGGDQYNQASYDSHVRRSTGNKQLKTLNSNRKYSNPSGKSSRTKTLTHLSSNYNSGKNETLIEDKEGNLDSLAIGGWQGKKRVGAVATKRVRSNWVVPKIDENQNTINQFDEKYSGGEELEDGYRDFTREDSESPINSQGNHEIQQEGFPNANRMRYNSSSAKARAAENRDFEISSDTDGAEWRNGREGVRIWLDGLGLGKYWPFFEIHEVDDEVLPLLTLEDLKDMGISAVGSRRKMYCAIQKLNKEFS